MSEADDMHDEPVIEGLVDDPVVNNTNPICAVLALERDAPGRTRIVSEKIDRGAHALLFAPR